eukprot:SAG31_NODE_38422_length_296_cov_0.786802_1_plen_27_part_10
MVSTAAELSQMLSENDSGISQKKFEGY